MTGNDDIFGNYDDDVLKDDSDVDMNEVDLAPEENSSDIDDSDLPDETTKLLNNNIGDNEDSSRRENEYIDNSILLIDRNTPYMSEEYKEATLWHEIRNAYITQKVLTGTLGGIERTETKARIAVVYYNGFRVAIPVKEMNITVNEARYSPEPVEVRLEMIISSMIGCQIDFIIKGIENKSRTVVASRKDAMYRKRQSFYLNKDATGRPKIYPGRRLEARIIAVGEGAIRIDAFGVECAIGARDLVWGWGGNCRDLYNVGDAILVTVTEVTGESKEDLTISVNAKGSSPEEMLHKLRSCKPQSKYSAKVTDVYQGIVFLKLSTGVNAVAHSSYDTRMPGKNDICTFVVTHIDEEQFVAVGLISRIIKQNL